MLADGSRWLEEVDLVLVADEVVTDAVLFHRASASLILTDLIENFEPARVNSWFLYLLIRLGGVADLDGKAPIDLQWTFCTIAVRFRTPSADDRLEPHAYPHRP